MHWTVHVNGGPPRVEHATVAHGDNIYFFGGYCETLQPMNFKQPIPIYVLNTRNYQWKCLQPPDTNDKTSRTPEPLRGHTAVVYGDKIYIWGGTTYHFDNSVNTVESDALLCFDTVTLKWDWPKVTGSVPTGRYGHTACVIDNCMYIFGGESSDSLLQSNEVYCLDLLSLNWRQVFTNGDPPPCLTYSTAEVVNKRMYIYGGTITPHDHNSSIYFSDLMFLDISTRKWHKPAACGMKPPLRGQHSSFIHNTYFYVFGGHNPDVGNHYNDLHRFHLETNRWEFVKPLGTPPKGRHQHSSLVVGEKVFVFGGTSSVTTGLAAMVLFYRNDVHVLDMSPSLRTLCMQAVMEHQLKVDILPEDLKKELSLMLFRNFMFVRTGRHGENEGEWSRTVVCYPDVGNERDVQYQ